MKIPISLTVALLLAITAGCEQRQTQPEGAPTSPQPPRAAVELVVLVVDDPALAEGVRVLRGEWNERSAGQLVIKESTLEDFLAADTCAADLLIYPSRHVGTLVARNWLRPVRDSVLDDPNFAFDDFLPLIRNRSTRFGGMVVSVSLGESPLMLAWRTNEEVSEEPRTWNELDQLAGDAHSPALELLGRAASAASKNARAELLFDAATMQPRLAEQPFVQALKNMASRAQVAQDQNNAVAVTIAQLGKNRVSNESVEQLAFMFLPKASRTHEPLAMLGFSGRSMSVTRSTRNAASAFKLLAWLGGPEIGSQFSRRSEATLWYRASQVSQASRWLSDKNLDDHLAPQITKLLSGDNYFLLPRIPGIDDYLQSLNNSLTEALQQSLPAEEALANANNHWNAITERLGREQQLRAYRQHLGLDTPAN